MLTFAFASQKLSTGANGPKEDAASTFVLRFQVDRAVMQEFLKVPHGMHQPSPDQAAAGIIMA